VAIAQHFIDRFNREFGKTIKGIAPDAERLLTSYNWPGNIRELRNAVERAVLIGSGPLITVCGLGDFADAGLRLRVFPRCRKQDVAIHARREQRFPNRRPAVRCEHGRSRKAVDQNRHAPLSQQRQRRRKIFKDDS
jgi:DNA-binding NtrC family response regulator